VTQSLLALMTQDLLRFTPIALHAGPDRFLDVLRTVARGSFCPWFPFLPGPVVTLGVMVLARQTSPSERSFCRPCLLVIGKLVRVHVMAR